jgi:long-chain acyl-CoA synthetase
MKAVDVGRLVRKKWQAQGARPALLSAGGRRLSYRELLAEVERRSAELSSVVPGECVLVGSEHSNLFDFSIAYFSALTTPGVVFDASPSPSDWAAMFVAGAWQRVGPSSPLATTCDDLVVVSTSGTTGRPKRIVHSFGRLLWAVWNSSTLVNELAGSPAIRPTSIGDFVSGMSPTDQVFLTGMPSGSIASLSVLNRSLMTGDVLAVPQSLEPSDLADAIVGCSVTSLGLPPFTAQALLRSGGRLEGHSLLQCGVGGAGTAPALFERLEEQLGVPVISAYGTTELGGAALIGRPWDPPSVRWHSAGRPIGAVRSRILGEDGKYGPLELSSPSSMVGILEADLRITQGQDWLATGDIAERADDRGNIRIVGRHDYVIQRGGRQIDPAHIEAILDECPSVIRSGVGSVPSRVPGEQDIVALVAMRPGHVLAGVREFCVPRLPPHQVPRRIHLVEEIPVARDGSPDRRRLATGIARLER